MTLTKEELLRIETEIERATSTLAELGCDSIRIIASVSKPNQETGMYTSGRGNWFSQIGSVREWLDTQNNEGVAHAISAVIPPRTGGGHED